jgi:nucleoside-diphosphate-sugar epimerase
MRVLLIGGTGLISVGIVKHLLDRGADVTMFNRGKRGVAPEGTTTIVGDREDAVAFDSLGNQRFDVAIDMIGFTPQHAEADVRVFAGKCRQLIFCSTVCTYGVRVPANVLIDESFPQAPISNYGRNKVACERILLDAHARGAFQTTIVRPSHTYGSGGAMIDQLAFGDGVAAWGRLMRGEPILLADGGLGLWNSTHRDDCGKLFAGAAMNPATFGRAYNATTDRVFTWRDYYREAAYALGAPAPTFVSMPSEWIVARDPKRFGLLAEITRFHGAYSSAAAKRDVPCFGCKISFVEGVRETFNASPAKEQFTRPTDAAYQQMIDDALAAGVAAIDA